MAQVTITLNARDYTVGCGDGEQARIRDLARAIDARIKQFGPQVGQSGEARVLVMLLLTMADELVEARAGNGNGSGYDTDTVANGIKVLTRRLETVADRLEGTK
ncbi:MAG TPA: cell division protein ZapA [Stellaceae bacterium]|jgi:cell division protein ZapA|nr:cell division protein ZapA [Stellaceae bacterium]